MTANKLIDEIRAAIRGHIPAAVFVRASERKKIPTDTPESNARPKPGGKFFRVFSDSAFAGDAGRLTRKIATSARATPANVSGRNRSPIAKANTTGIMAAMTAVVGATTAIVPTASARYKKATPMPPLKPATNPQVQSREETVVAGKNGRTNKSKTSPANCDQTTVAIVFARRAVNPPKKSAEP